MGYVLKQSAKQNTILEQRLNNNSIVYYNFDLEPLTKIKLQKDLNMLIKINSNKDSKQPTKIKTNKESNYKIKIYRHNDLYHITNFKATKIPKRTNKFK